MPTTAADGSYRPSSGKDRSSSSSIPVPSRPAALPRAATSETWPLSSPASAHSASGSAPTRWRASRSSTAKNGLDFPLLSDPDRTVARAFGARRPGPLFNRRATFVISQDRRLLAEIKSELSTDRHADEALRVLRALAPQAGEAG